MALSKPAQAEFDGQPEVLNQDPPSRDRAKFSAGQRVLVTSGYEGTRLGSYSKGYFAEDGAVIHEVLVGDYTHHVGDECVSSTAGKYAVSDKSVVDLTAAEANFPARIASCDTRETAELIASLLNQQAEKASSHK